MSADCLRSRTWGFPAVEGSAIMAAAGGALALAAIVLIEGDSAWMRVINGTLPIVVGATCLWSSYRMVRLRPIRLWTPFPWFLAAWAVYYGFGPMIYVYGTPESVAYMDNLFPVDDQALLRTNVLNWVGLLAVVGAATLMANAPLRRSGARAIPRHQDAWRVGVLFLAIGLPVEYLLELPYVLRLTDHVLPGSIQYFGTFSRLAILPLSVAASERHRWAKIVLWCLVLAEVAVGLVMLSKLQIITTVLLVLLGRLAVRANIRALVMTGVLVAVAYVMVLSPFVNFARWTLGRASAQDVAEALDAVQAYRNEERETLSAILPGVQSWWTRLAYANSQAFAMTQYDLGKPGWTFAMVAYILVPRFIYEDKPIMTPGIEYTRLIQGTDTSSTGLGFIGEAYWNGGWLIVLATGFFVAALFSWLGRMSRRAVISRRWLYTPLIYQSIYLALRPDDWFIPAYIGGVLQVLIVVVMLSLFAGPLVTRRSSSMRSRGCNREVSFPSEPKPAAPRAT